ncbi:LppU/SCO3897 family protein [Hamadaea tsunoensis]|uniref:LppU/SCO3897 family protein n=1 Tax=Hamadaea tsunoensis TaxID=53368 RepID=UPI001FE1FB75|nr:hypothetical protein [Hamadaea tsunoensis]
MRANRALLIVAGVLAVLGAGALALVALTPGAIETPARQGSTRPSATTVAVGARFAQKGDCLVNDGSDAEPLLRLVSCGPEVYQVIARFEGTTDADKACAQVTGYQYNYSYDSPLDNSLDFVLCLKSAEE